MASAAAVASAGQAVTLSDVGYSPVRVLTFSRTPAVPAPPTATARAPS